MAKTLNEYLAATVAELIRELGSIPSGHLYAQLMGHLDIHQYEAIIIGLEHAGLIKQKNHLLTWVGPKAVRS